MHALIGQPTKGNNAHNCYPREPLGEYITRGWTRARVLVLINLIKISPKLLFLITPFIIFNVDY